MGLTQKIAVIEITGNYYKLLRMTRSDWAPWAIPRNDWKSWGIGWAIRGGIFWGSEFMASPAPRNPHIKIFATNSPMAIDLVQSVILVCNISL